MTFSGIVGAQEIHVPSSTNVPEGTYVLTVTAREVASAIEASYDIELIFSNSCASATLDVST